MTEETMMRTDEIKPEDIVPERQPIKPLFYTVAIDPVTGAYDARSNAGNVAQVQIIANALLQEYQRLNGQIIAAVSQNGAAKQEA